MPTIGTPLSPTATKVLMCGSGELGKEAVMVVNLSGRGDKDLDEVVRLVDGGTTVG